MKLINDKITCMPGLTLFFFFFKKKKISRRTIPSEGQQGTKDCDDNSFYRNKTTSTTVFKYPNEHKEKNPSIFHILDKWS